MSNSSTSTLICWLHHLTSPPLGVLQACQLPTLRASSKSTSPTSTGRLMHWLAVTWAALNLSLEWPLSHPRHKPLAAAANVRNPPLLLDVVDGPFLPSPCYCDAAPRP